MKTLEDYMQLPYRMEITPDAESGGYVVSFPDLKGCIACADRLEDAVRAGTEARRAWLTAALREGQPIPQPAEADAHSGHCAPRIPKLPRRRKASGAGHILKLVLLSIGGAIALFYLYLLITT